MTDMDATFLEDFQNRTAKVWKLKEELMEVHNRCPNCQTLSSIKRRYYRAICLLAAATRVMHADPEDPLWAGSTSYLRGKITAAVKDFDLAFKPEPNSKVSL